MTTPDVIIVGSGPNGLTAAACLARAGLSVHVVEASNSLGGGLCTQELTLPGFSHDVCSAVHTMGCMSPIFEDLELEHYGLRWVYPKLSVAHPLDGGDVTFLAQDVAYTAEALGEDQDAYTKLVAPFCRSPRELMKNLLSPLSVPSRPWELAKFGLRGCTSARRLTERHFRGVKAPSLFAGCAAHAIQPLENALTAAFGLTFLVAGHAQPWPVAAGGSESIAKALVAVCHQFGVTFETGMMITDLSQLPESSVIVFDLAPIQVAEIAQEALPASFRRKLQRYRMGPGCFKIDWALSAPIPWANGLCNKASTVHLGGTLNEICLSESDVWAGRHSEHPFVLVAQQSMLDPSRAPEGKHTGYAYCHVPAGSTVDQTDAIERQLERFAPGFRDCVLARKVTSPREFEAHNASYIGGAITGGVADFGQLFARPTARLDPYSTPNRRLYICSQSTPPGGGVHGMCGYHAANSVLARRFRIPRRPLPSG